MMRYTIGRNAENDLIISDSSVSGEHAEIIVSEDFKMYTLKDLGSTNGTFINNRRVVSKIITENQNFKFGNYVLSGEKLFNMVKNFVKEQRTDFSMEFAEMLQFEKQFLKTRRNINKNFRLMAALPKLVVTIVVVLVISLIPDIGPELRYPLMIGATLIGTVISTLGVSEQKKEDKLNKLKAKFQLQFKCPKCDTELYGGSRDGNYYKEKQTCMNKKCNATWKVN